MRFITYLSLLLLFTACKKETNKTQVDQPEPILTTAQKIANAHGIEQWNKVSKIQFVFNTPRGQRSWSWEPKSQNVVLINKGDTTSYNRTKKDSAFIDSDRAFINDKYWLLAPFQLIWDKGTTISEPIKSIAPISIIEMNKITLTYSNEGGYTPGDAYDFYYGDDFIIREWVFRRGNSEEPSLMTTWEDYEDFQGIKISKKHRNAENDWALYFTGIDITIQ